MSRTPFDDVSENDRVASHESQDENEEHERRLEELSKQSMEWLHERARISGIPDWKQLSKQELVRRLSDSSAPPH